MANIKANIKNIRKTKRRNLRNKQDVSAIKTLVKKARNTNNADDLSKAYQKADSICARKKIHKNKANRLKSRAAKAINKAQQKPNKQESKTPKEQDEKK